MTTYSDLNGVVNDAFKIGKATLNAGSATTPQTYSLPAEGGVIALTSQIASSNRMIDGGAASTVYLVTQNIDGGSASMAATRIFDGGDVNG